MLFFFFFKQKTAYEIRPCDWSSDVCSSDLRLRKKEIPKDGGKVRILSIPSIRDRVVQGALKLILEPIFEADFQSGSYGYRPKKSPKEAIEKVSEAIVKRKTTRVIDVVLKDYF